VTPTGDPWWVDDDLGRVGVLIVRAWREPATKAGFRARISAAVDLGRVPVASIPVAGRELVLVAVIAWLDGFLATGGTGGGVW
jgi:hypothetical protein